ncbi:MAG: hypothetical protein IJ751_03850, partial [Oscillospiraceae bacterium]|nr:hypothetical protein [Oscillospiraceae bacterium]
MKKALSFLLIFTISMTLLASCGEASQVSNDAAHETISSLTAENEALTKKLEEAEQANSELQADYDILSAQYSSLETSFNEYKAKMAPYEELDEAEAQVRQIEANAAIEAAQREAEAAAAAEAAALEERERQGYDTGITYDQLARTPDDYVGELVKFTGSVVQVTEGDGLVGIRFAINGNYDQIIYCEYESTIVSSRVLEDDYITIY